MSLFIVKPNNFWNFVSEIFLLRLFAQLFYRKSNNIYPDLIVYNSFGIIHQVKLVSCSSLFVGDSNDVSVE